MSSAYGHTKWSISEFQAASPKAKWQKRKANILHCLLSLEDPSNKAIAAQLGLTAATVGRILAMPDVREKLEQRLMGLVDIQAVTAMGIVEEAMRPDKPFAVRLHTAKWLLERRDKINARVLHRPTERLPNELSAEERLKAIIAKRHARLAAKAIPAQVVGEPPSCPTAPGSSGNGTQQPASDPEASASGPTAASVSTSSPTTSSDSASSSVPSPSPN